MDEKYNISQEEIQKLEEIAKTEINQFETFKVRNSDSLDFKEIYVGDVKRALIAAYELGKTKVCLDENLR